MVSIMEKICILILFVNLFSFAVGNQDNKAKEDDPGGLWFGPRLGKRSLRPLQEDRQTFLRLLEAADALKYYYDQLQYYDQQADDEPKVTKKVIFTPKLGRSVSRDSGYESVDFTPRLGRRLTEDMPATPADRDLQGPEQIDSRIKYYTPRLGRNMNFSPRLGRELSFEVYPEKIRVVRSANKTKAT